MLAPVVDDTQDVVVVVGEESKVAVLVELAVDEEEQGKGEEERPVYRV